MDLHWPFTVPVVKFSKTQHAVTPCSEASIYLVHVLVRLQEAFTSKNSSLKTIIGRQPCLDTTWACEL